MGVIPGAKTIPMDEIPDNLKEFNKMTRIILCVQRGHAVLK